MKEKFAKVVSKVQWYFLKRKWLKALRSGEYTQTKSWLKNDNEFCCLGVLCDISEKGEWDGSSYVVDDLTRSMSPADSWFPEVSKHYAELMMRNDGRNQTFAQIADYIQENL